MAEVAHKITVQSPFLHTRNPERYAGDPFYQHRLVAKAATTLLDSPFEASLDLRGCSINVVLHEDGLHATAELIQCPDEDTQEALMEAAKVVNRRIARRQRAMERVDLLGRLSR